MEFIILLPIWALALGIFFLRIVDVSMGTVRTIAIVEGRINLAVVLGFFEVLVWILAISQVIMRLRESPVLPVVYAAGFAAGNAVGILIERKLAMGTVVLRMISSKAGKDIADNLRRRGESVTTFVGDDGKGAVTLLYLSCPRRGVDEIIRAARGQDPDVVYVLERSNVHEHRIRDIAHPTGWRAFWKKK